MKEFFKWKKDYSGHIIRKNEKENTETACAALLLEELADFADGT